MKQIFLFILLISSILSATPTLNVTSKNVSIKEFDVEYFVDDSQVMELSDIKSQKFTLETNKFSLGGEKVHTWIRFNIHNSTSKPKKLFLHNSLAFLSLDMNFYELKNDNILNSIYIDLTNHKDGSVKKMYGTDSIFAINLDTNETKTIYLQNNMTVTQFIHFTIYDEKNSKKSFLKKDNFTLVLLGMLFALALYHLIIYISTGYKEYLFYSLYLLSAALWQSQLSGILTNNFAFYFTPENKYFLSSVILLPIFITLFTKTIFHTQTTYPLENKLLNSVILFFSLTMAVAIVIDIDFALSITKYLYVYMFIIIFLTTSRIMKKGNKIALIFLWGNGIFAFFALITDLYYSGLISYSYFAFNAAHIGIVIEALILSYIIAYRIKLLRQKEFQSVKDTTSRNELQKTNKFLQLEVAKGIQASREKDKILFQKSKMISMGEMIENIAHQWRQPLAEINASVSSIDNTIYKKYDNDEEIDKELVNIENLTAFMSKTIDSFKDYFEQSKEAKEFSLRSSIYDSIIILGKSLENENIIINIDIEDEFIYEGYQNEFQQVILVLLNNAKEALITNKILNPKINIKISASEEAYRVSICDNANGIKNAIIDKIFDPYFTTKEQTQGTGLGLYISKMIIEDKMHGTIHVRNIVGGACFNITFKREKLPNE